MAIYSLHHAAIGKTTQARPYTAAAHVRYIVRAKACGRLIAARMPEKGPAAQAWLRRQEDADRKNGRVCDKVLLALPRELSSMQRAALVRSFAERVTEGRASWLAAFHEAGKDASNPHCHLLIRDRDPKTGKRVCGMSEKGSTERLRLLWEQHTNHALSEAGRQERVDRRTLEAQGIKRRPTIHEGLSACEMAARGRRTRSRPVNYRNGAGARSRERLVDYRRLDRGRSRPAHNRFLQETEADYWAAIDGDRIARQWAADDAAKPGEGDMSWRKKIADKADAFDRKVDGFLHDPTKPVKTGKNAPMMHFTQTSPDPRQPSSGQRPMTAREQQQMSVPEAIYKKGLKPAVEKARGILGGGKENEAARAGSFSEKIARDRAEKASDPARQDREKTATIDRWKRDREKEKERGR